MEEGEALRAAYPAEQERHLLESFEMRDPPEGVYAAAAAAIRMQCQPPKLLMEASDDFRREKKKKKNKPFFFSSSSLSFSLSTSTTCASFSLFFRQALRDVRNDLLREFRAPAAPDMDEKRATLIAAALLMKAVYDGAAYISKTEEERERRFPFFDRGKRPVIGLNTNTFELDLAHYSGWRQDRNRRYLELLDGEELDRGLGPLLFSLARPASFKEVRVEKKGGEVESGVESGGRSEKPTPLFVLFEHTNNLLFLRRPVVPSLFPSLSFEQTNKKRSISRSQYAINKIKYKKSADGPPARLCFCLGPPCHSADLACGGRPPRPPTADAGETESTERARERESESERERKR